MAPTVPALPARKGKKLAASSKELPIANAQILTLDDGTQVCTLPMCTPNMPFLTSVIT